MKQINVEKIILSECGKSGEGNKKIGDMKWDIFLCKDYINVFKCKILISSLWTSIHN